MSLRPYQLEAVGAIGDHLERHRSTLAVMPTGTGKTVVFAKVAEAHRPRGRVLVLAHREELILQAQDKIREWTDLTVEIEMADQRADLAGGLFSRGPDVVVASKDSIAHRLDRYPRDAFGLVIVDECFPAGTMIGDRRIENIRVGDVVPSYDEETGQLVHRRVVRLFSRPCRSLVRIVIGDRGLVCTPNHPVLTGDGWRQAGELTHADVVRYITHRHGAKEEAQDRVRVVRQAGHCDREGADTGASVWPGVLLGGLQALLEIAAKLRGHGRNEPEVRIGADEEEQPDASTGNSGEDADHAPGHGLEADRQGWERDRPDRAPAASRVRSRVGDGSRDPDEGAEGQWVSDLLQGGHRQRRTENRDRGRRELALLTEGTRHEEGCILAWARVDRVEVLEPESDGRFGGLCPDGAVYNLEVEGTHTYIADDVVVHNCHHAPAKRYQTLLDHFGPAKVLGVTATPDRLDGLAMGATFDSAAFVYEIRDAIESGYLCPIRQKVVEVESLDLSRVKTVAGDLNQGQLAEVMEDERNLHELAAPAVELAGDRPTLVFTVSVEQAHLLEAVLNRYAGAGKAVALDGSADRDTRRRTIASYLSGEIQFLVNCALFTEGFDAPSTACVVMARPTKSRALYTQMLGRGTRIAPGKDDLLVLDFAGNAGQHSLISALDVLEGVIEDETKKLARKLAAENDLDILEALAAAEEELAARARLEEARRRRQTARAKYGTRDVSPFKTLSANPRSGRWGGIPPTYRQIAALEKFGLEFEETTDENGTPTWLLGGSPIDKGQASALLDKLVHRASSKLCTYKQARFLMTRGLDPDVTFDVARGIMDAISANGWRVPADIAERYALREKPPDPSEFARAARRLAEMSTG